MRWFERPRVNFKHVVEVALVMGRCETYRLYLR